MGASASVTWDDCNEQLTEQEVKDIIGPDFNQAQFDAKKDKETNLLPRATLMETVDSFREKKAKATSTSSKNLATSASTGAIHPLVKKMSSKENTDSTRGGVGLQLNDLARGAKRHKSFETDESGKKIASSTSGKNSRPKRMPRALSMETDPTAPPDSAGKTPPPQEKDTWESVQAQPSCAICGMVFTSMGKLDTHIKYSSVHVSNLKKLDDKEKAKKSGGGGGGGGFDPQQEEESDRCRVLYTGNKHFWRTQDNLDITIYLHIAAKCLEVIAYEGKANLEYPRIYLDEAKIVGMITEASIWDKVAKREEVENKKKFKKELPPREVLFAEEKRLCISTFILQRLKLVEGPAGAPAGGGQLLDATKELLAKQTEQLLSLGVNKVSTGGGKQITYAPETQDAEKEVTFDITRGTVTPVLIPRRRHSTDQEIKDTIDSVEEMQNDIRNMTERAAGIANTIHRGVETFNSKVRGRNERAVAYSRPRQRWIFAIKRVLRQAQVRQMTAFVLTFGDKYYTPPAPE